MVNATAAPLRRRIKTSWDDRLFYVIITVILSALLLIILYPLVFIVSASFSSAEAVSGGRVFLWPVDLSLEGYEAVFKNDQILTGYLNSIFYTLFGTLINLAMTLAAAYPLARANLPFRGFFMFLFTFTMLFDGGMIPHYILLKDLHMLDTRFAIIIPGAIAVYNMIITRTFIQSSIPVSLLEAAQIDGCSDARFFFSIVLPLSKAVIAVITLYYAVAHWNTYFNAFLYLNSKELFPLQIVLRDILVANTVDLTAVVDPELMAAKQGMADLLKYSLIIVSSLPVLIIYPFIQKYFVQGVMIGSLKG